MAAVEDSMWGSYTCLISGNFLYEMLCFSGRQGNTGLEGRTKSRSLRNLFSGEDGERSQ